ncbi:MAG: hypothetical protein QXH32_04240 [Candidatus Caldarchaeum sp.]
MRNRSDIIRLMEDARMLVNAAKEVLWFGMVLLAPPEGQYG